MKCTVTAIIPTYNRASLLRDSIQSVLGQTRPPDQVIVVDDGSTDQTPDVVSTHFGPRVTYFKQLNSGKAAALNRALTMATGDFLWFFDDDDVALEGFLENHLEAFRKRPDLDVVVSPARYGEDIGDGRLKVGECARIPSHFHAEAFPALMRRCAFNLQGIVVRQSAVLRAGPFDVDLLRSQDYDMILRLFRDSRYLILDEPDWIFRKHSGVRGPAAMRHAFGDRERIWVGFDRKIGRKLREAIPVHRFRLDAGRESGSSGSVEPEDYVSRAVVMATKGLLPEFFADLDRASSLWNAKSPNVPLPQSVQTEVFTAVWDEYVGLSLIELGRKGRGNLARHLTSKLSCMAMMAAARSVAVRTLRRPTPVGAAVVNMAAALHSWLCAVRRQWTLGGRQ